jgi:hypothetical protein
VEEETPASTEALPLNVMVELDRCERQRKRLERLLDSMEMRPSDEGSQSEEEDGGPPSIREAPATTKNGPVFCRVPLR